MFGINIIERIFDSVNALIVFYLQAASIVKGG